MAAFVAKAVVGNKLNAVKGKSSLNYHICDGTEFRPFPTIVLQEEEIKSATICNFTENFLYIYCCTFIIEAPQVGALGVL